MGDDERRCRAIIAFQSLLRRAFGGLEVLKLWWGTSTGSDNEVAKRRCDEKLCQLQRARLKKVCEEERNGCRDERKENC